MCFGEKYMLQGECVLFERCYTNEVYYYHHVRDMLCVQCLLLLTSVKFTTSQKVLFTISTPVGPFADPPWYSAVCARVWVTYQYVVFLLSHHWELMFYSNHVTTAPTSNLTPSYHPHHHPHLQSPHHLQAIVSRWRQFTAHQRLGHVSSLCDVLAVFLVRHPDSLFRHHLPASVRPPAGRSLEPQLQAAPLSSHLHQASICAYAKPETPYSCFHN